MKYKISLGVFFLLFLFGCFTRKSSKELNEFYNIKQIDFKDFPQAQAITGIKLSFPEVLHPRRVLSLKNFLIVSETKSDTLIHIFQKPDFNHVGMIGVLGHGPDEIQSPWALLEDNTDNVFWVQQLSNKTLSKFDLNNISVFPVDYYRQEGDMVSAVNLVWSSDSTLIGTRADGWDKFVEYSKSGKVLHVFGTWHNMLEQDVPSNVVASIHQGRVLASPDRSKFLLACLDRDLVEILDKRTSTILSIRGPLNHIPKFSVDYSPGYPMASLDLKTVRYCYVSAAFSAQYIYLLYSGHTMEDVDIMRDKFCEQVLVMDFEGNVSGHYILDTSIKEFSVDESARKIYGLTIDSEPNVIVFDF